MRRIPIANYSHTGENLVSISNATNNHLDEDFFCVFAFGSFFLGKLPSKKHFTWRCAPHASTSFNDTDEEVKLN